MSGPFLQVAEPAGPVAAFAVVLHGGRARGTTPVTARQLAVARMVPFTRSLQSAGRARGLAVAHVRYRVRGWNGPERSPVADVEEVLDRLCARFPGAPAALVGHSMGGRAAVYAAAHPQVRGVVALAPWIEDGDPTGTVAGRRVLVAHGDGDRVTSARASAAWADTVAGVADSVGYVSVRGDGHAMLRRARTWHQLATGFVLAVLRDVPPEETVGVAAAKAVEKALAGTPALRV